MSIYSDLNQYNPYEKVLLTDIESVYQSLHNILATRTNERLFNPDFGSEFESNLFEPIDTITEVEVFSFVIGAVERLEPRVKINYALTTLEANEAKHKYDLKLIFGIEGYGEQSFEFKGGITQ